MVFYIVSNGATKRNSLYSSAITTLQKHDTNAKV